MWNREAVNGSGIVDLEGSIADLHFRNEVDALFGCAKVIDPQKPEILTIEEHRLCMHDSAQTMHSLITLRLFFTSTSVPLHPLGNVQRSPIRVLTSPNTA